MAYSISGAGSRRRRGRDVDRPRARGSSCERSASAHRPSAFLPTPSTRPHGRSASWPRRRRGPIQFHTGRCVPVVHAGRNLRLRRETTVSRATSVSRMGRHPAALTRCSTARKLTRAGRGDRACDRKRCVAQSPAQKEHTSATEATERVDPLARQSERVASRSRLRSVKLKALQPAFWHSSHTPASSPSLCCGSAATARRTEHRIATARPRAASERPSERCALAGAPISSAVAHRSQLARAHRLQLARAHRLQLAVAHRLQLTRAHRLQLASAHRLQLARARHLQLARARHLQLVSALHRSACAP